MKQELETKKGQRKVLTL